MTVAGQTEQTARHRSQLFPLRLNRAQKAYMAQAAGCARFAYNWALEQWKLQAKAWWDSGKVSPFPTAFTLNKQFNAIKDEQFPWFREVSCHPAQSAIIGVGEAMANYRSGNTRYPRFHARGGRTSFVASPNRREFKIDGKHIVLPRVGRLRLGAAVRWPDAPATRAVVSQRAGRWYVAVSFELPPSSAGHRASVAAGVDLGVKTPLVVAAGGVTIHIGSTLSERLKVERRKLKRANRRLARRTKGSGRHDRARLRVARIHERMRNIRADVQHKATCQIARMASRVGVETLAVRNMMRNGRLARSIADVGFYEIKRQLRYKADQVVEADKFYPSSKTCSACGSVKRELGLSDRVFHCDDCGNECDRDENAARNLETLAANWVVSARGAGSSAPMRKHRSSSLARKREAMKGIGS